MVHLTGTAIIGYGYILSYEEVDMDKYEHDLYNTDMIFPLDCTNYESPWFYGIILKRHLSDMFAKYLSLCYSISNGFGDFSVRNISCLL